MNIGLDDAYDLIQALTEQNYEDKLFFRWVVGYQDQMSFDEFKAELKPVKIQSEEEILANVYDIIERTNGGLNGNI